MKVKPQMNYQPYKREGAVINLRDMNVHEALRVARAADGLTQTNIVNMLGFSSVPRYSLIENGIRPVPENFMSKVEQYLYGENEQYED
ncbi:helix-turn-helix transcriptional regulator [Bacillus pacificus]|uniref:helix-turn-helix domain-containing protein n=1 Tax=Bacillus cereus group TaxID=86661 RepID=UPI0022E39B07|nr:MULTISPECIES: helix-turn-helix transcriptional regulator [Bacillus cereus group]MDA2738873.1 helix-turn-helix transcriptional regulator [Bacillus cereus group sp. Bc015]MED1588404.1 helix-turn-helix transcriptional regulator [Bacillus pacificus]